MIQKPRFTIEKIAFIAIMAAMICVVTFFRFPLLGSKVHFANALCVLSGLLLGPVEGGLAAGIGSAIYDIQAGYGAESLITFFSKFAMAFVAALIAGKSEKRTTLRVTAASVAGSWTYVALYMLKTVIVYGAAGVIQKFPASAINAVFAMIVAPVLYFVIKPALVKARLWEKLS
ncbi:MAG: ECF transporter S component [Oscillospiraceae bacterium]|nr:ECF transporter S component [Oscillospiraceae bacterium]